MAACPPSRIARHIQAYRDTGPAAPALPFCDALDRAHVERVLKEEGVRWRQRLFTPLVTLWGFLWQVLSPDGSCRAAVSRLRAYLVARGQAPCAASTGSYCKARQRLPERVLARLVRDTGQDLSEQAEETWRWKGRTVKVVDGSTVSMPDTPENQAEYPHPTSQQPGLGFPLARLVAVFGLASGSALDVALGPYQGKETGEAALLRQVWDRLEAGDVVLGDCLFSAYLTVAGIVQRGADYVGRQHQRRKTEFRRGRRLGRGDHVVPWRKPARPAWLDEATYQQLPDCLEMRELRVRVPRKGFRTEVLTVVTTLVDAAAVTADDLAVLYRQRWHAELDLRALKSALGMDILRGKTPEMVRKEVWMHLLAYNLIRTVMAQVATQAGLLPRTLSFTGARQALEAFREALLLAGARLLAPLLAALFGTVVAHRVGQRPDRREPRAVKRRRKPHPLLTVPRQQAKAQLRHRRAA